MSVDKVERSWYDNLQKHARANYAAGWDWVVECVDWSDFVRDCAKYSLDTWDKVMLNYTVEVELRQDRMDDVLSESAW